MSTRLRCRAGKWLRDAIAAAAVFASVPIGASLRPIEGHDPSVGPNKSGECGKAAAQGYSIIADLSGPAE
jgi:hypothetical protein